VADTTLRLDRRIKMPLYARTGVREAWLCDLMSERVEVYRGPGAARYREVIVLGRGEALTPLAFSDVTIAVEDLLG
jgi:Uma2 family endonuclease